MHQINRSQSLRRITMLLLRTINLAQKPCVIVWDVIKFSFLRKLLLSISVIFIAGFLLPELPTIPVKNATSNDWNQQSFWYYPWGRSIVHKGIDIFAKEGEDVIAATQGLVIYTGYDSMGGNIVLILGSKWRFHYYAHLKQVDSNVFQWVSAGDKLGEVGTSGNAQGKSPHLHYTIRSIFPRLWKWDQSTRLPWQRLFFINPSAYLKGQL